MDSAKLDINYLIIMALICEFCNKFVFSVFDTIVSQYGEVNHQLTSLQFRYALVNDSLLYLVY